LNSKSPDIANKQTEKYNMSQQSEKEEESKNDLKSTSQSHSESDIDEGDFKDDNGENIPKYEPWDKENAEENERTIYLSNLPTDISVTDLRILLAIKIDAEYRTAFVRHSIRYGVKKGGYGPSSAFVVMDSLEQATRACSILNNFLWVRSNETIPDDWLKESPNFKYHKRRYGNPKVQSKLIYCTMRKEKSEFIKEKIKESKEKLQEHRGFATTSERSSDRQAEPASRDRTTRGRSPHRPKTEKKKNVTNNYTNANTNPATPITSNVQPQEIIRASPGRYSDKATTIGNVKKSSPLEHLIQYSYAVVITEFYVKQNVSDTSYVGNPNPVSTSNKYDCREIYKRVYNAENEFIKDNKLRSQFFEALSDPNTTLVNGILPILPFECHSPGYNPRSTSMYHVRWTKTILGSYIINEWHFPFSGYDLSNYMSASLLKTFDLI
jgi:hypothetical protein